MNNPDTHNPTPAGMHGRFVTTWAASHAAGEDHRKLRELHMCTGAPSVICVTDRSRVWQGHQALNHPVRHTAAETCTTLVQAPAQRTYSTMLRGVRCVRSMLCSTLCALCLLCVLCVLRNMLCH
jgi:hypothetical protein